MKKTLIAFSVLMILSIQTINAQSEPKAPPPPPPSPPKVLKIDSAVQRDSFKEEQIFLEHNPSVARIDWESKEKIIIRLKNGKLENYDLMNEKKSFVDKYGMPPIPPPPPPLIKKVI